MIIPTRLQLDILSCIKKLPSVLACTALVTAQAIPRDEIRSTTVPYVPPAAVSLRAEVRVVEVPVVVRDGQRHIVTGLTRDDFEIYDDGKKQAITAFSVQTDELQLGPVGDAKSSEVAAGPTIQPRSRFLALCFDNLHLSPAALPPVKEAAERFIRTNFAPGDSAVVVSTSQSSNTQFTADVPTLLDQIAKINITHLGVSGDLVACPHFSAYEAYQVANSADPGNQVLNAKVAACSGCSHHPCPESLVRNAAETVWAHVRQNTTNTLGVIDGLVDSMERLPGQRLILLTSPDFSWATRRRTSTA
jgi:VWFA-related protein